MEYKEWCRKNTYTPKYNVIGHFSKDIDSLGYKKTKRDQTIYVAETEMIPETERESSQRSEMIASTSSTYKQKRCAVLPVPIKSKVNSTVPKVTVPSEVSAPKAPYSFTRIPDIQNVFRRPRETAPLELINAPVLIPDDPKAFRRMKETAPLEPVPKKVIIEPIEPTYNYDIGCHNHVRTASHPVQLVPRAAKPSPIIRTMVVKRPNLDTSNPSSSVTPSQPTNPPQSDTSTKKNSTLRTIVVKPPNLEAITPTEPSNPSDSRSSAGIRQTFVKVPKANLIVVRELAYKPNVIFTGKKSSLPAEIVPKLDELIFEAGIVDFSASHVFNTIEKLPSPHYPYTVDDIPRMEALYQEWLQVLDFYELKVKKLADLYDSFTYDKKQAQLTDLKKVIIQHERWFDEFDEPYPVFKKGMSWEEFHKLLTEWKYRYWTRISPYSSDRKSKRKPENFRIHPKIRSQGELPTNFAYQQNMQNKLTEVYELYDILDNPETWKYYVPITLRQAAMSSSTTTPTVTPLSTPPTTPSPCLSPSAHPVLTPS